MASAHPLRVICSKLKFPMLNNGHMKNETEEHDVTLTLLPQLIRLLRFNEPLFMSGADEL